MTLPDGAPAPRPSDDRPLSRAAFFGWGLGFISLIALSVVGLGHSPQIRGAANLRYAIVVVLVAAALGAATVMLARSASASRSGEAFRRFGVAFGATALVLFVWEAIAVGRGLSPSPVGIVAALLGY